MRRIKEKRGNDIVKSMNSNFAKETNQRDEDAEMQKFIEEHLRQKKEQEAAASIASSSSSSHNALSNDEGGGAAVSSSSASLGFKRPADALFDVPKFLIESRPKHPKAEESMSEQMLSGIPEVDLGVDERIRNIEDTERAKQRLGSIKSSEANTKDSMTKTTTSMTTGGGGAASMPPQPITPLHPYGPQSQSVNFVQHKRFDDALINPEHMIKPRMPKANLALLESQQQQPTVGDGAPKHKLLQATSSSSSSGGADASKQPSDSRRNRHSQQQSQSAGRHNARRKYYVSTNQDEPESARLSTSGKRRHAGGPGAATTTTSGGAGAPGTSTSTSSASGVVERASDDYCLERFKKNMRFSRNSKIKIA